MRQVPALTAQQVEDVVGSPRRGTAEILQEIELRSPAVVEGDEFSIDDSPRGQAGQCLDDIRELLAEGTSCYVELGKHSEMNDKNGRTLQKPS